jgi:hypothetical protein
LGGAGSRGSSGAHGLLVADLVQFILLIALSWCWRGEEGYGKEWQGRITSKSAKREASRIEKIECVGGELC